MTLYFTDEEQAARRQELFDMIAAGDGSIEWDTLDGWGRLDANYLVSVGRLVKRRARRNGYRRVTYFIASENQKRAMDKTIARIFIELSDISSRTIDRIY